MADSLRTANQSKRRTRTLDHARALVAKDGFDGPNLIGKKEQVLIELKSDLMTRAKQVVNRRADASPLEIAEAIVLESTVLFKREAQFSKSSLVASEYIEQRYSSPSPEIRHRSELLPTLACLDAQKQGLLRGTIVASVLGAQIFRRYRTACRDWAFNLISIEQFSTDALMVVYLCLAADAEEAFHRQLRQRTEQLPTGTLPKPHDCSFCILHLHFSPRVTHGPRNPSQST